MKRRELFKGLAALALALNLPLPRIRSEPTSTLIMADGVDYEACTTPSPFEPTHWDSLDLETHTPKGYKGIIPIDHV